MRWTDKPCDHVLDPVDHGDCAGWPGSMALSRSILLFETKVQHLGRGTIR